MIVIRTLPRDAPADARRIVTVAMNADERRRVRRRLDAPDGQSFALELPTGTILREGQVLHLAGECAYVVSAAPEDVILIRPRNQAEAARVGHLIGNMHRDIDVQEDAIVALWDDGLAERLRRTGVQVDRARRPFHGNAPGEHSHAASPHRP
jgi:urease accessory protein